MRHLLITGLMVLLAGHAHAFELIIPNDRALVEGDGNNGFPFLESTSVHYQQAYDASQFTFLGTNGGAISSVGFRYNGNYNTATMKYFSFVVSLSTITRAVTNLSSTFSENIGPDNTVVYSGTYSIGVTPPPADGKLHPWPFPMTIPFNTPFYYNPTNGNLLLDIQWTYADTYAGTGPPFIDAVYYSGNLVSRVYADNIYETYIPTNGTVGSIGLVTEFGVSPLVLPSPKINNTKMSGTNVLFSGSGGTPGTVSCALATTNLASPRQSWVPTATNTFDGNGNFTVTNGLNTNLVQQFYILQLQ